MHSLLIRLLLCQPRLDGLLMCVRGTKHRVIARYLLNLHHQAAGEVNLHVLEEHIRCLAREVVDLWQSE